MGYFTWLKSKRRMALDESISELKKTLEEHREECEAKSPETCPYEQKVEKAIEQKTKEIEREDNHDDAVKAKALHVTPEEDAAYLEAVGKGDVETAAKMVRDVAARTGYGINLHRVDSDHNHDISYKGKSVFYAADPAYYEKSATGYRAEQARPYFMKSDSKVFDPMREFGLDAWSWDNIPMRVEDLDRLGIEDEGDTEEGDTHGITSTEGLAQYGVRNGYDATLLRGIPNDGGWGGKYDEYAVHDGSVIKHGDSILYDDEGNVIPLSERFGDDSETGDGKIEANNGSEPLNDDVYMEAVAKGDMKTAAKMVLAAAARAMPNTKVVDENGLPLVVWHGGNFATEGNYKADLSAGEMHFGTKKAAEERVEYKYAALKVEDPEGYRKEVTVKPYYLNLENPKRVKDNDGASSTWLDWADEEDRIHDGIIYENESEDKGEDSYGVSWNPSLIKSADPITYDDEGNPIPLSKRFNFSNTDVRY